MTQGDLAVAARSTVPYIGFIERAGHMPGPDLRRRIAQVFGVEEIEIWPDTTDNVGN
jgi:transcriptional regulator with XRE-family HTH domain